MITAYIGTKKSLSWKKILISGNVIKSLSDLSFYLQNADHNYSLELPLNAFLIFVFVSIAVVVYLHKEHTKWDLLQDLLSMIYEIGHQKNSSP